MCHTAGTVARGHVLGAGGPTSVDPDYENASYILFVSRSPATATLGNRTKIRGYRKRGWGKGSQFK
jgi:thiosulfate reductase/polysulfide reductase chain A